MNWTLIITAVIAALPPTLVALLTLRHSKKNAGAIQEVHLLINSRMTELLQATKGESRAEGKSEGKIEEREEVAQRNETK